MKIAHVFNSRLTPKRIVTDGAHGPAIFAEALRMVCEVSGSSTEGLARREHIPEDLSDPYDHLFLSVHAFAFFMKTIAR